ncbi:transposase [Nocardiopsis dassonvillei]|uniref:transposase n=1 Tax=Nocardiopsis dassonvillei TaxID=2014 RepID=UPI003405830B
MGRGNLARHREKGAERGTWTVFEYEAGASLTGALARAWAPAGQTPVLTVVKGNQPKLSMAALCCYREGEASRMLYRTKPGWYHGRDLTALLSEAQQVLKAPIILIWANLAGHHSRRSRRAIEARTWLEAEYLPAYASELNLVGERGRTSNAPLWPTSPR